MANVNLGKVFLLFLASTSQAETAENNGCFTFPGLSTSLSLTAMENETITIPFQPRRNSACFENGEEPTSIYISGPTQRDFCLLSVDTAGICLSLYNQDHCQCPGDGNPHFLFTTTVIQEDRGTWTWRVGNDQSRWTEVLIEVQRKEHEFTRNPQQSGRSSNVELTATNQENTELTSNSVPTAGISGTETGDNTVSTQGIVGIVGDKGEGSDEEGFPGGQATFGGVFVGVNVVTVIAVAAIVYVIRGRRERKRRHPGSPLPPTPKKKAGSETSQRAEPVARESPANSYIELSSRPESRKYEQIPAAFGADGNHYYEGAVFKGRQQVTNSGYGIVV